jgi:hypothetical protein
MRDRRSTTEVRERQHRIAQEHERQAHKPNGEAAAAILAAAIGVLAIGILTTLAEASEGISDFLNWYSPTGALSGKTGLGSLIWLAAWLAGHVVLRKKEVNFTRIVQVSAVLIVIGLLLLFPPIFGLFAAE